MLHSFIVLLELVGIDDSHFSNSTNSPTKLPVIWKVTLSITLHKYTKVSEKINKKLGMLNTLLRQYPQLLPRRHRLRAGVDIQLGVNVIDVPLHRARRQKSLRVLIISGLIRAFFERPG